MKIYIYAWCTSDGTNVWLPCNACGNIVMRRDGVWTKEEELLLEFSEEAIKDKIKWTPLSTSWKIISLEIEDESL